MLEYFTYKKIKKHQQEKDEKDEKEDERHEGKPELIAARRSWAGSSLAAASPEAATTDGRIAVLDADQQSFFERLTMAHSQSEDEEADEDGEAEGERPPLPPRIKTPDLTWDSDSESFVREDERSERGEKTVRDKGKGHESSTSNFGRRLSQLLGPRRGKGDSHAAHLVVPGHADVDAEGTGGAASAGGKDEEARERDEIVRVLEELDQAAAGKISGDGEKKHDKMDKMDKHDKKGKKGLGASLSSFSLSGESTELVRRFVVVLKDLVNGVPTAADDLRHLLDDRDGALSRGFERLPSGLRKLVAQLPSRLTSSLAPELLAAAAESQGLAYAHKDGSTAEGAKAAAKAMFLPMLTKPSSIVKMLKAIINALKLRWPAFIGTSAIWSVALFILLFVLWYCHKRGREVRLGNEADAAAAIAANEADTPAATETPVAVPAISPPEDVLSAGQLPPPPIGSGAAVPKKNE